MLLTKQESNQLNNDYRRTETNLRDILTNPMCIVSDGRAERYFRGLRGGTKVAITRFKETS